MPKSNIHLVTFIKCFEHDTPHTSLPARASHPTPNCRAREIYFLHTGPEPYTRTENAAHQEATGVTAHELIAHAFFWAHNTEYTSKTAILHLLKRKAHPWKARFTNGTQTVFVVLWHSQHTYAGGKDVEQQKRSYSELSAARPSILAIIHSAASS